MTFVGSIEKSGNALSFGNRARTTDLFSGRVAEFVTTSRSFGEESALVQAPLPSADCQHQAAKPTECRIGVNARVSQL
jgi:hypothetical protein